ncbi:MAG: C-terminal binding protein [Halobacteriales archaeon]
MDPRHVVVFDTKRPNLAIERQVFDEFDGPVEIEMSPHRTEAGVIEAAMDAEGIMVDAGTPVTERVLDALDALKIVARVGIGVDNIAIDAAHDRGIAVTNVPDYSVDEVSTHALGLLITLAREIPTYNADTEAGNWDWKRGVPLFRLQERTLGVIAFGRIGRRIAQKAKPLFETVVAYDPYLDDDVFETHGVERVGFDELLRRADAISMHTPLTEETESMIDTAAFETMAADDTDAGMILINTSRGGVIDEEALIEALDSGTVRAAGLDVLAEEPPSDRRLLDRDDVIVTPHIGWYSEESRDEVRRRAAEEIRRVFRGEIPANDVTTGAEWL